MSLMQDLTDKAGELGMGRIGAVRPEAMEGYAERVDERARKAPLEGPVYEGLKKLSRTRELFPEAGS